MTYNDEKFLDQKKKLKLLKKEYLEILRIFFHQEEEENYYKLVRVSNFWSNNYIEYESNSDRNKTLSVEEYLNKRRPYITTNLKNSETQKI